MNTFNDLLMRTEELERRMLLSEIKQKNQLKILSFASQSLTLSANAIDSVMEIKNTAGQASLFVGFSAINPYAASIPLQLLINDVVVDERTLPASQAKPVHFCMRMLFDTTGEVVFSMRAVYSKAITLTNVQFDVFGGGVQN